MPEKAFSFCIKDNVKIEPSCGTGRFYDSIPAEWKEATIEDKGKTVKKLMMCGFELDKVTAHIARLLHPDARIRASGYETFHIHNGFDLIIGNIPFGDYKVHDPQFINENKGTENFLIHDYFFAKAVDELKPSGVLAFITSKGTLDKQNDNVRRYLAQRAELIGAIRLPNNAFAEAGTSVTSDIIFLRKREQERDVSLTKEPDWVRLGTVVNENGAVTMNNYFIEHPEMILGDMRTVTGRFGRQTECLPREGESLDELLAGAVENLSGEYGRLMEREALEIAGVNVLDEEELDTEETQETTAEREEENIAETVEIKEESEEQLEETEKTEQEISDVSDEGNLNDDSSEDNSRENVNTAIDSEPTETSEPAEPTDGTQDVYRLNYTPEQAELFEQLDFTSVPPQPEAPTVEESPASETVAEVQSETLQPVNTESVAQPAKKPRTANRKTGKADNAVKMEVKAFESFEDGDKRQEFLDNSRKFSYKIFEDKVYYRRDYNIFVVDSSEETLSRIRGLAQLEETVRDIVQSQIRNDSDEVIAGKQAKLNTDYDNFVAEYGYLTDNANRLAFQADDGYFLLRSLENLNDKGEYVGKTEFFSERTIRPAQVKDHVDTAQEALVISINEKARVDMDYMRQLLATDGEPLKTDQEIAAELKGLVYFSPEGLEKSDLNQIQQITNLTPSYQKEVAELDKWLEEHKGSVKHWGLRDVQTYIGEQYSGQGNSQANRREAYAKILEENATALNETYLPLMKKGRYVTADEYLSGNIREKLEVASACAVYVPEYQDNVDALTAVLPKDLEANEIDARLGSTWIDPKYISGFIGYILGTSPVFIKVEYSSMTSEWNVKISNSYLKDNIVRSLENTTTYGTHRASALKIIEDTLNLKIEKVFDTVKDNDGKEKRVLNSKETTLAQQKQQAIKDAFKEWIWKDPSRRRDLVRKYNDRFNSTRQREYNGENIPFTGMNQRITMKEHQKNAVARILYGGNTLLAHEVGAGKTFEMAAAAMESKRLGLCQKPLFIVPNHLTEQWATEFTRLYPAANILVATDNDFKKDRRKEFCARVATGNYDAVIMGHSQFKRISMSPEAQQVFLQQQIQELEDAIKENTSTRNGSSENRFSIKRMESKKKSLAVKLRKLIDAPKQDNVVTFEELGVDRLFVDEAHAYKNLGVETKMDNIAGISTTGSAQAFDLYMKCRYLDEKTDGKGIIFATGTPVSNSVVELYTMQKYLQYDALKKTGLINFDSWVSTFGDISTSIELAPQGTGYRARTRFAKFFNLPELMTMFKEVADIKMASELGLERPTAHYETIVAEPSDEQREMVAALSERATKIQRGQVPPWEDNMLKITSDGRKLGLDQRLINGALADNPDSKVNKCISNIFNIWQEGKADRLTQLVFCDLSIPTGNGGNNENIFEDVEGSADGIEIDGLSEKGDKDGNGIANDADLLVDAETSGVEGSPQLLKDAKEMGNGYFADDSYFDGETGKINFFSVYEDIKYKLVAMGIPAEEIAFIHDAKTKEQKETLFGKVRSGEVRVLLGSTAKMGAGTNVQDKLVALHDLDCPWRPGDLEQRAGRIVRQGNHNKDVHIFRYVTENTFDAYLWQTVQKKQEFIGQIMTTKSPARACDDIDVTALSYAEIKALCAGDPRIKEKMDLEVETQKLQVLKNEHDRTIWMLQDRILQYPNRIEQDKVIIERIESDVELLKQNSEPVKVENGKETKEFAGMKINGVVYMDRVKAGQEMTKLCTTDITTVGKHIGEYRGMDIKVYYDAYEKNIKLSAKGTMTYTIDLGDSASGNMTRLDNLLNNGIPKRLEDAKFKLETDTKYLESAKAEIEKPFPQMAEYKAKTERLNQLNIELNMENKINQGADNEPEREHEESHDEKISDTKELDEKVKSLSERLKVSIADVSQQQQRTNNYRMER